MTTTAARDHLPPTATDGNGRRLKDVRTIPTDADGFPLVRRYQGDFGSAESVLWRIEARKRGLDV